MNKLIFFGIFFSLNNPVLAINAKKVTDKISFDLPLLLTPAPQIQDFLFVVEQVGTIKYFKEKSPNEVKVFLNIKSKIDSGGEKGLLGLAFHPEFRTNGIFYLNYTAQVNKKLKTIISSMKANPKTLEADSNSEQKLFDFEQPAGNHNGGSLAIGPDNYLYIASGDGGFAGDPFNNGQKKESFLGKILRIKIEGKAVPEIFAWGLRNPWKISFDSKTGNLWTGDVGQEKWEEINIIEQGKNYGWRTMEGNDCFKPSNNCKKEGLIPPLFVYPHQNDDCSITGGYVYRGSKLNDLMGSYIYGDFCSGRIWSFNAQTKKNTLLIDTEMAISSFGQNEQGDLYVLDHTSGHIFKLEK